MLEELPKEQHAQVRSLMRAAYKLERADEGLAKMEKMASWTFHDYRFPDLDSGKHNSSQ
ncbi:MAG: hypothetical protein ACRD4C_08720 [Candidatus Acidiferrales bacterium]